MSYQPPFTITPQIIELISDISLLLGKISHLNQSSIAMKLRRKSKIKTITGTLQIEGNTLDENQITAFLEGKLVMGSVKELAEVRGAISAYDNITQFDYKNIKHLLKAHQLMMDEILVNSGKFRDKAVGVFGADGIKHIAPPANRVNNLMQDLFSWLKTCDHHPLIVSSVFHFEFEFIHPFIDGNGRLGRLWQYLILHHWQDCFALIPVENMVRNHQQDYYRALQQSGIDGNSTAFILFMLQTIRQSIFEVQQGSDYVSDHASDQVQSLMKIMNQSWMSTTHLMESLTLSHKPTFRKNYLNPALQHSLIEMRFPESPRSPKQKYRKISKISKILKNTEKF